MKKAKIDLKKLFEPKDIIPILAVLIGIIVAISYNEIEIRLIGVCIFILGGVPLFISISSKLPAMIEKKYKPQQTPEYNINVIRQNNATRMVIEDSDFSSSSDEYNKNDNISPFQKEIIGDEGIRIVGPTNKDNNITTSDEKLKKPTPFLTFSEGESGVTIVGTIKPSQKIESQINQTEKIIDDKIVKEKPIDINKKSEITQELDSIEKAKQEKTTSFQINKGVQFDDGKYSQKQKQQESVSYKEKSFDVPINLLMEPEPIISEEPKKEFELFLKRILDAIRSAINTKTAIFFLVNFDRGELILQAYSSDIKEAIIRKRKIPLGNDIVSQIVKNSKPEILTEINPKAEIDLIPYYTYNTNTQSFIGIPVLFKNSVIGILCADSTLLDAYDSVTVNFLGQFTKLISALVHSYTEKYDLLLSAKTLKAINSLRKLAYDREVNIEDFYNAIIDVIKTIFDYQTIGICTYNMHSGNWYISSYYTNVDDKNFEGLEIEPTEALIGESILSYKTIYQSPILKDKIRVMKGEHSFESGFFVSVPLKSCSFNYGAIYVEGSNPSLCNENDLRILETIGEQAGSIIEQLFYADIVNIQDVLETQTGILSTNSFLNRLDQELKRINDYQSNFCLCQIRIDKYATYSQEMFKEKTEIIYHHVINIIKENLKQYDIIGKTDDNTFGILLIGKNLNQSQLWAEKLRTDIAKSFLIIKTRRFNATISIGIAEANNMTTIEEILTNSLKALEIAYQKSNKVVIYQ